MKRDREHFRAWQMLRAMPEAPMCWRGCGRVATTVGHNPPRALHDHVQGTGCCELLPECKRCNFGDGTAIARARNRRRTNPNPSRVW